MEAFHEKTQTYFRGKSYKKVNENQKFQNVVFFQKHQNFETSDFHWLFHRKILEDKFAIFHQKFPSSRIGSSELSGRIPFKFGLKWPHKVALGGKIVFFPEGAIV